jgi:hypothetical protein
MSKTQPCKLESAPKPCTWVQQWGEGQDEIVDCDSVIGVADWARRFTINRLDNDVSNCVERCVVGTYQIGYLYDHICMEEKREYQKIAKKKYIAEGVASVLLHFIASYEMTGREFIKIYNVHNWDYRWSSLLNMELEGMELKSSSYSHLSIVASHVYKYQRWILYHHMNRAKRWNEDQFQEALRELVFRMCLIARKEGCDLASGFQECMQKLLDLEIKRH